MIIRSIRLKNIKSYGEGANGGGITVELAPGINRIAGRNGHGKSTLIESLGYALFLTPPLFEERFDVSTYLLRAGESAGEIDVTLEHDGDVFRVERGLGIRSQRRSKVVQLADNSTAAEGDCEVAEFVCRLLRCPDPQRLSELFARLIGVKQGRLAWPFDSKPQEARNHFEPLLDVEIFRQCFDRLKPVVAEFSSAAQTEATRLAAVAERVRDRQDAPEQVKNRRLEVEHLDAAAVSAKAELKRAENEKVRWETLEKAWIELRDTHEKAKGEAGLAKANREHAEQRLNEASKAVSIVSQTAAAHAAFVDAEKLLSVLQDQQREKAKLEKLRAEANASRVELEAKTASAKAFADDCEKRRSACELRAADLKREAQTKRKILADTKEAFDRETASIQQTRNDEAMVRHWVLSLAENTARLSNLSATIETTRQTISAWDSAPLESARAKEQSSAKLLEELAGKLSAASEVNSSLRKQLAEIAGGVCPFLKEQCRQFDPAKVGSALHTREADIAAMMKQLNGAREAHTSARADVQRLQASEAKLSQMRADLDGRLAELRRESDLLVPSAVNDSAVRLGMESGDLVPPALPSELTEAPAWSVRIRARFDTLASSLQDRFDTYEKAREKRLGEERDLIAIEKEMSSVLNDAEVLSRDVSTKLKEAESLRSQSEAEGRRIDELEKGLKPFATLDEQMAEQQSRKVLHADAHQRYLTAKPMADVFTEREQLVGKLKTAEETSARRLEEMALKLRAAAESIDSAALETARRAYHEQVKRAGVADERLGQAKRELARDEKRLREFEKASTEKAAIDLEIGRIHAAIALTEKARGILKNAAPHVAQHLCRRIAARAQQIFNYINHEPSELEWNSERYSLRIHPGDRRFAMLSGGEQTKLALAMTLAMIQEFSGLKFCVFDEPTYGVDGESRLKLVDAILAAQEAASFDQLILVSHDDAFDGRIEHTVRLTKTAAGSQPVVE
jgi:DNA repair protein SbcC/Rad50